RRRRHHREAAARTFAGEIDVERDRVDALQAFADRHLIAKDIDHQSARVVAVALIALDVELALVAEGAIEARPVHAGRSAQVIERGRRKAVLAEQVERLAERDIRLIGARPAPALGRGRLHPGLDPRRCSFRRNSLLNFLYHFAENSLTADILCETV